MQHLVVKRFPLNWLKFNAGCNLYVKYNFGTSSIMFQNLEHQKIVKPQPLDYLDKIQSLPISMTLDKATIDRVSFEFNQQYGVDFKKVLPEYFSAINECIKKDRVKDKFMYLDFNAEQLHIYLDKADFKFPFKRYNSFDFLEMARHFLSLFPPDTTFTSEALWGSLTMCCRELFSPMGIAIFTTYATKALYTFAATHHPDKYLHSPLFLTLEDIYKDHKRYYNGGNADYEELEDHCLRVELMLNAFKQIDISLVEKELKPFLEGQKKTNELEVLKGTKFVKLDKPEVQLIVDKSVEYIYEAK